MSKQEVWRTGNRGALANSWPPDESYISKSCLIEILERIEDYVEYEKEIETGDLVYFYTKIKMHCDYYKLQFEIPESYRLLCKEREEEMIVYSAGFMRSLVYNIRRMFK